MKATWPKVTRETMREPDSPASGWWCAARSDQAFANGPKHHSRSPASGGICGFAVTRNSSAFDHRCDHFVSHPAGQVFISQILGQVRCSDSYGGQSGPHSASSQVVGTAACKNNVYRRNCKNSVYLAWSWLVEPHKSFNTVLSRMHHGSAFTVLGLYKHVQFGIMVLSQLLKSG